MSTSLSIAGPDTPSSMGTSARGLHNAELEALYKDCAKDVYAYAISLLRDRATAEDVTALAFERLYKARRRLDRSKGTPRALLFAIARNAALDELRRMRRQPAFHADLSLPQDPQSAEDFEAVERRAEVHAALAALPLREREVVLLKFHGQLSNRELAKALGVSESNAGTRLHRALQRLRQHCGEVDREVAA